MMLLPFPFIVTPVAGVFLVTVDQGLAVAWTILVAALFGVGVPYLATSRQPVPDQHAWRWNGGSWKAQRGIR